MNKTKWTPENLEENPSFSDDIRLYSHSGLCNRLRLIVAYKHFSDITNKKIEMFWVKSPQCKGLFKDLFQPIPNINFTYLKYGASARPENTATKTELFPHDEKIKNKNHLIFKPVDGIMQQVESVRRGLTPDYIACHIRRTDIITIQKKLKITPPTDEQFEKFIEDHPDKDVFLATDNRDTQERFIKKFPKRIKYACGTNGNGSKRWPKRTTSIQDAVKDLFLCIGSSSFMGTACSSYSTFIENYKKGQNE